MSYNNKLYFNEQELSHYTQHFEDSELYKIILNLPSNMPETEPEDTDLSMGDFLAKIMEEIEYEESNKSCLNKKLWEDSVKAA